MVALSLAFLSSCEVNAEIFVLAFCNIREEGLGMRLLLVWATINLANMIA